MCCVKLGKPGAKMLEMLREAYSDDVMKLSKFHVAQDVLGRSGLEKDLLKDFPRKRFGEVLEQRLPLGTPEKVWFTVNLYHRDKQSTRSFTVKCSNG